MAHKGVIGLEIHVELATKTKIFCGCKTEFGKKTNSQLCPTCLGLPGALPVLNKNAVKLAVKTALLLNSKINLQSSFDRKNYFYPDLVKGYQITQYYHPLANGGFLEIGEAEKRKKIKIDRIHIEEDAGKSIHRDAETLLDFNRSGVPLMEIVTEPDFADAEEVVQFLQKLREILLYGQISDCKLEHGSMRVDVNISLALDGEISQTKSEIKNLNSYKTIEKAITCELLRQKEMKSKGQRLTQQTLRFDERKNKIVVLREKESTDDYMYFPEYDLPSLHIDENYIQKLKGEISKSPEQMREDLAALGLARNQVEILLKSPETLDYFYKVLQKHNDPQKIANLLTGDLTRYLKQNNISFAQLDLPAGYVAETLQLEKQRFISSVAGKKILLYMLQQELLPPKEVALKLNLTDSIDEDKLNKMLDSILESNEKVVEDYIAGKDKALGFLMGIAMKQLKGKGDPQKISRLLQQKISNKTAKVT